MELENICKVPLPLWGMKQKGRRMAKRSGKQAARAELRLTDI